VKNSAGNTALIDASREGHVGIVRLLLNKGADVNVENNAGNASWDYARTMGHEAIIDLL